MNSSYFSKKPSHRPYQEVSVDIDTIISKLFYFPNKLKFLHHNTTSYAKHKALDFAYEELSDLQDEIIEKIIGCTGYRYNSVTFTPIDNYSDESCIIIATEIKDFAKSLKSWSDIGNYLDISQLADTYWGVGAKLAYLLTLE